MHLAPSSPAYRWGRDHGALPSAPMARGSPRPIAKAARADAEGNHVSLINVDKAVHGAKDAEGGAPHVSAPTIRRQRRGPSASRSRPTARRCSSRTSARTTSRSSTWSGRWRRLSGRKSRGCRSRPRRSPVAPPRHRDHARRKVCGDHRRAAWAAQQRDAVDRGSRAAEGGRPRVRCGQRDLPAARCCRRKRGEHGRLAQGHAGLVALAAASHCSITSRTPVAPIQKARHPGSIG
jgi:hypothetical protein